MNKNRLSHWMYIGLLVVLTACQAAGQPLERGDGRIRGHDQWHEPDHGRRGCASALGILLRCSGKYAYPGRFTAAPRSGKPWLSDISSCWQTRLS